MSKIKTFIKFIIVVFFLISCSTPLQQKTKPSVEKNLPPGVEKVRLSIPNGGTLQQAKVLSMDTGEPLKVNVNEWLNKLVDTNSKEYVEPEMFVYPIFDSYSCFTMKVEDIAAVNQKLINKGFKFQIESKERCLNSYSIP